MNIEKRYWQWTEGVYKSAIRLNADAEYLLIKGLIQRTNNAQLFKGVNEVPWMIQVGKDNKVFSISYRNTFFQVNGHDIENMNLEDFTSEMSTLLNPVDETYEGDRLCAVFRDSYLAVLIITRQ